MPILIAASPEDPGKAQSRHRRLQQFSPRSAAAYHNRGNAHAVKGDIDRAIVDFGKRRGSAANARPLQTAAAHWKGDFRRRLPISTKPTGTIRPPSRRCGRLASNCSPRASFPAAALLRPMVDRDPSDTPVVSAGPRGEMRCRLGADASEFRRH